MKALILEVDERLLEERRRLGHDVRDEMWEGVLHMVPPAGRRHQRFGGKLYRVLGISADKRGLESLYETGLYRPGVDDDYRVPDLMFVRPELVTERGVDGPADLVVEIRSPGDETYLKLPWYADLGVSEMLVIDRDTLAVELFRGIDPVAVPVEPLAGGAVHLDALDVEVEPVDATCVRVVRPDGEAVDVNAG